MKSHAILSLLPAKEQGSDGTGKFLMNLLPYLGDKYLVLMQNGELSNPAPSNSPTIINAWDRKKFGRFKSIIPLLEQYGIKSITINFEYRAFGGFVGLIDLILLMIRLKLFGYQITGLVHHSLLKFRQYRKIFSLDSNSLTGLLLATIYFPLLYVFHNIFLFLVNDYVVLESFLEDQINTVMPWFSNKVHIVSHPVYEFNSQKKEHQKYWNVLYFGHITRYKGIETLLDAWERFDYHVWPVFPFLHIAGGRSSTANDFDYYDKMVSKISDLKGDVKYYGYVSEAKKKELLSKSDVLILPYAALVATSGPFATAIGAGIPVQMSVELSPLLNNADIQGLMAEIGLNRSDLVYGRNSEDLIHSLIDLAHNRDKYNKLVQFMVELSKIRKPTNFVKRYKEILSLA